MLLIFGIVAGVMVVSGAAGAVIAARRGRSRYLGLMMGALLPLLGHVILLLLRPPAVVRADHRDHRLLAAVEPPAATVQAQPRPASLAADPMAGLPPASPADRWRYLVAYDPLLREATRLLAPYGPAAIDELRTAHFALQDRTLVPAIVDRIQASYATAMALPPLDRAPASDAAMGHDPAGRGRAPVDQPPLLQPDAFAHGIHAAAPLRAHPVIPDHTTVTAADLDGASFVETYRGVHLYRLEDGRIFIDGALALGSLDAARRMVDISTASDAPRDAGGRRPDALHA